MWRLLSARICQSMKWLPPPVPSPMKFRPGSAVATISFIAADREFRGGRARTKFRLPKLRRSYRALGRPLRSLQRVEYDRRGRRCDGGPFLVAQGAAFRRRAAQGANAR